MGVATSTVGQMLVPMHSTNQTSTAMRKTEKVMLEITIRVTGLVTEGERRRLLESLSLLRVGDLKMLLSESSLTLEGNKACLIDRLIKSYEHGASNLNHADRTFASFFQSGYYSSRAWLLEEKWRSGTIMSRSCWKNYHLSGIILRRKMLI